MWLSAHGYPHGYPCDAHLELLAQLGGFLISQLSKQGQLSSKPLLHCQVHKLRFSENVVCKGTPNLCYTNSKSNYTFDICVIMINYVNTVSVNNCKYMILTLDVIGYDSRFSWLFSFQLLRLGASSSSEGSRR